MSWISEKVTLLKYFMHAQTELTGHLADFPNRNITLFCLLQKCRQAIFGNTQQQPTAGLRVKEQHLVGLVQGRVKADPGTKPQFVIAGSARKSVSIRVFSGRSDERNLVKIQFQTDLAGLGDFAGVPKQAEAGDIGCRFEPAFNGYHGDVAVQALHPTRDLSYFLPVGQTAFEGGGSHAKAQRFAQEQVVSGFGAALGQDFFGFCDPDRHKSKFGFVIGDGVTACYNYASLPAFFSRSADDSLRDFVGQVGRKGSDIERQERFRTHGIDIREAVGGGNSAVIVRIVDHRGEEIGGDHQGLALIQLPDSSIISRIKPDQKIRIIGGVEIFLNWQQDLRQRLRVELGSSARATGKAGQTNLLTVVEFI